MNTSRSMLPKHLLLSLAAGLMMVLAFPSFSLWYLAWLAPLPLLIVIYEAEPRLSFFYGCLTGTVFFLGLVYWLLFLYPLIGFLAVLAWTSLAVFQGLFVGVFAYGANLIKNNYIGWGRLFIIPAWWASVEFLRSSGWLGFSWGILGYSQEPFASLAQIASKTGVYGISFVILMTNVAVVELLGTPKEKLKTSLAYLAVALIIMFEVVGSGFLAMRQSETRQTKRNQKKPIRAALVQGNIPQDEKWDPLKEERIKEIYYKLIQKAGRSKPYVVILPESAVPSFLLRDRPYLDKLKRAAQKYGSYLLVGSLHLDGQDRQFNSAVLIGPDGRVLQKYDKLHLVPFGEQIPFKFIGDTLKKFEHLSWVGESITPGKEYTVFKTGKGKFSAVICFESADPALCRRMIREGAGLLAVITNDAWFGRSAVASQHLQISAFRAIENRRFLVQVANTGISAIVDPDGRILDRSSLLKKQLLKGFVSFEATETFYTEWGDIFVHSCLLLSLGCFAALVLKKRFFG